MKKDYTPLRYVRSLRDARADLPSLQEGINRMLDYPGIVYQCRMLPDGILEVFGDFDPLTTVFRHDARHSSVQLSEGAASALHLPAEMYGVPDEIVEEILRTIIAPGRGYLARVQDGALVEMMLDPVRRIAAISKGEA